MLSVIETEIMDNNRFQTNYTGPDYVAKVRVATGFGEVMISEMKIEKLDSQLALLKAQQAIQSAAQHLEEKHRGKVE